MAMPGFNSLVCNLRGNNPFEQVVAKTIRNGTGFTRGTILQAVPLLEFLKQDGGGTLEFNGLDLEEITFEVPADARDELQDLIITRPKFRSYQQLALHDNNSGDGWLHANSLISFEVERYERGFIPTEEINGQDDFNQMWLRTYLDHKPELMYEEFLSDQKKDEITACLANHVEDWKQVHNIVCFAIGSLAYRSDDRLEDKVHDGAWHAYYLINHIREELARIQGVEWDAIKQHFDIDVVSHGVGYFKLTSSSFVICRQPEEPVRQIVTQRLAKWGGPAAMLCDRIVDDGMDYDGRPVPTDPSSPWVLDYSNKSHCFVLEEDTDDFIRDDRAQPLVFGKSAIYLRKRVTTSTDEPERSEPETAG